MKTETIRMTVTHVTEECGPHGVCWRLALDQPDWNGHERPLLTEAKLAVWTDPALHVGDVVEVTITPAAKDGRP